MTTDQTATDCVPWCDHDPTQPGPGHTCYGTEHRVTLSRYPAVQMGDGTYQPAYLSVYALRSDPADHPLRVPLVHLGEGEDQGVELTPADAAALITALRQALDEIGQP